MFSLGEATIWTKGRFDKKAGAEGSTENNLVLSSVSIDTRTIQPGSLYVALKGERFDGHTFLKDAERAGAAACLVEKPCSDIFIPQIVVPDTLKGLQEIAKNYRKKTGIPVIGVTGSNGKTITKNFIASILQKKFSVASTKGNLNNHIGLPLSILSIKPSDEIAVFEFGMNHPGEIKALVEICQPTAAVITNIGVAHIENFHSKEAIAKEKASIAAELIDAPGSFLVIPAHDEYAETLRAATKAKVIEVSANATEYQKLAESLRYAKDSGIMAEHFVMDALLAVAVAREYGIADQDIVDAVSETKIEDGRFALKNVGGVDVIDDTYNANPDSVCAALDAFAKLYPERRKIFALGKLMEQGEFLNDGYERIIDKAMSCGISGIIFVDVAYENVAVTHVKSHKECAEAIKKLCNNKSIVLLKGSRFAEMEKVFEYLK